MKKYFVFLSVVLSFCLVSSTHAQIAEIFGFKLSAFGGGGTSISSVQSISGALTTNVRKIQDIKINPGNLSALTSLNWAPWGTDGFSDGDITVGDIFMTDSGTVYYGYRDLANGKGVTVMKYNGTDWEVLGTKGFGATTNMQELNFAVDGEDIYVFYRDVTTTHAKLWKWNGSSWSNVETNFLGASFRTADIGVWNHELYIAYEDMSLGYPDFYGKVMKYNGSSFSQVGNTLTENVPYGFSIDFDDSGTPYIAYMEDTVDDKLTVRKLVGNTWQAVGSPRFSDAGAYEINLKVENNIPYVFYQDYVDYNNKKGSVQKYNGTAWEYVGSRQFTPASMNEADLDFVNGTPVVAFGMSLADNKLAYMTLKGSEWDETSNSLSEGTAQYVNLLVKDDVPYIGFRNASNSREATVIRPEQE